jgi:hypothetical protein
MFYVPDVTFFNGFNMILNDNVIDCFLEENKAKQNEKENTDSPYLIEDETNEPIENISPPQERTYECKKMTKK